MITSKYSIRFVTRALSLTAAGACAVTLAACGSSGASDPASAPPASTPSAVGSTSREAPAKGPVAAGTTTVTVSPNTASASTTRATHGGTSAENAYCAESQLRATVDPRHLPGNGTEDQKGRTRKGILIDFENTSDSTCVLYGYPGSATEDANNHQTRQAKETLRGELGGLPSTQHSPERVTLHPGGYASALIEGVDQREQGAAQAGCDATTPRILVTPPNTTVAVPFRFTFGTCFSFTVHPVRPVSAPN